MRIFKIIPVLFLLAPLPALAAGGITSHATVAAPSGPGKKPALTLAKPPASTVAPKLRPNPKLQQLASDFDKVQQDIDSLGDLSQEDQMRIQAFQDRFAKAMQALSNIMKKDSDTKSGITQNMK